ncbi:MAG TPA: hypothetical protein PLB01_04400 [Thermoanaerobaculia bacterium]|nr:hypothetical protein [Thermoanaerobaculia bacterium]
MITGFNTDVKHADRVYHVQTEDRGVANPVVESLVYVGGEILLSKKSPYQDLITGDRVDEKALREMMDLQHRRVIEAIRRGRLDTGKIGEAPSDWADDTLPSTDRVSPAALAAVHAILAAPSEPLPGKPPVAASGKVSPRVSTGQTPAVPPPVPAASPAPPAPAPPPAPASPPPTVVAPRKPSSGASPASASGAAAKRPGSGMRSLDQVIVDYLASEAASEHLELSLTSDAELTSGGKVTLTLKATTSLTEKPLPGVHVSIRVVSTVRPPQILFRGVTAGDGCVSSVCALPDIGTGNAALIIAASSALGNNEIKQLIKKKK